MTKPFPGELAAPRNVADYPGGEAQWRRDQAELERVIPRQDGVSWLYVRWENTDGWAPANRLLLWQVRPLDDTDADIIAALQAKAPRSQGHYCGGKGHCPEVGGAPTCPDPKFRWVGGYRHSGWQISQQQWDIYREIGRYAEPWWVVQGDRGGHRKLLFDWEQELMGLHSGGTHQNVPTIGDLPFAPFDQRVLRWVTEYDLLRTWQGKYLKNFDQRGWKDVERDEATAKKALGPLWASWLLAQVDEMYDGARGAWRDVAGEHRAGGTNLRAERRASDARWSAKWDALLSGEDE